MDVIGIISTGVFGFFALLATVVWLMTSLRAEGWLLTAVVLWITTAFYATQINEADDFTYPRPCGVKFYYLRWIFYAPACGFLILEYCRWLNIKASSRTLYLFTLLTLLTGAGAGLRGPDSLWFWAWTFLGFVFYGAVLILITNGGNRRINRENKSVWLVWSVYGWMLYPIVFVLGHAGFRVITKPWIENLSYALGDFVFKLFIPFIAQSAYGAENPREFFF